MSWLGKQPGRKPPALPVNNMADHRPRQIRTSVYRRARSGESKTRLEPGDPGYYNLSGENDAYIRIDDGD